MVNFKSCITYSKWNPVKRILFEGCVNNGVTFKELSYESGFLSNTLYFEVSGDHEKVEKFKKILDEWAKDNGF